ncbi:sigma D regulator [Alteromonadaceae bacterium BrNp21-10]|nr:sigma D regulator [Alteromonadaceae bacterium BrNp21-10]
MLTGIEQAKQKWGGRHSAIDKWLTERQLLLVQYCELAGIPPYQRQDNALPEKEKIQAFCELLMDYVSAGHFEVYGKLTDNDSAGNDLENTIYPKISESTDSALQFNDAYTEIQNDTNMKEFDVALSKLGQQLEERFELEDQLIQSLHNDHL